MDKSIELKIKETINLIFSQRDITMLSDYQKRKKIFSYLCDTLNYDFKLLSKIIDNKVNKTKISRNPQEELKNVIFNQTGICSSISQYYKLLLEQLGIKSYCIVCDDGTLVNHQLTLVYDNKNKAYSFDDITSVIVKHGEKHEYFDYDMKSAKAKGQGNKKIMDDESFVVLPEEYIDCLVDRIKSPFDSLKNLPINIDSIKNSNSLSREI